MAHQIEKLSARIKELQKALAIANQKIQDLEGKQTTPANEATPARTSRKAEAKAEATT